MNKTIIFCRHICDGKWQCPHGDDEKVCQNFTCIGLFRCVGRNACLNMAEVCDGHDDCESGEDEQLCNILETCPISCHCFMYAIKCKSNIVSFLLEVFLKYFVFLHFTKITADISGFQISKEIVFLIWSHSNLTAICFPSQVSQNEVLRFIDYTFNNVKIIDNYCFSAFIILQILYLGSNKLTFIKPYAFRNVTFLLKLDISNNYLTSLYSIPIQLKLLNILENNLQEICLDSMLLNVEAIITQDQWVCCFAKKVNIFCTGVKLIPWKCQIVRKHFVTKIMSISLAFSIVLFTFFSYFIGHQISKKYLKSKQHFTSDILTSSIAANDLLRAITMLITFFLCFQDVYSYNIAFEKIREHFICKFLGFISFFSFLFTILLVNMWSFYRLIAVKYPLNKYLKNSDILKPIMIFCSLICASLCILCSVLYHIVEMKNTMPSELCMYVGDSFSSPTLMSVILFKSLLQFGSLVSMVIFYFMIIHIMISTKYIEIKKTLIKRIICQAVFVCTVNSLYYIPSTIIYIASVVMIDFPVYVLVWVPVVVNLTTSFVNSLIYVLVPLTKKCHNLPLMAPITDRDFTRSPSTTSPSMHCTEDSVQGTTKKDTITYCSKDTCQTQV